jgi:hypothetical protein
MRITPLLDGDDGLARDSDGVAKLGLRHLTMTFPKLAHAVRDRQRDAVSNIFDRLDGDSRAVNQER